MCVRQCRPLSGSHNGRERVAIGTQPAHTVIDLGRQFHLGHGWLEVLQAFLEGARIKTDGRPDRIQFGWRLHYPQFLRAARDRMQSQALASP